MAQQIPTQPPSQMPLTPAFPGAEGFGAKATGGRGCEVYEVTNLNDSGPGSLRDALSQGNRTIVFRVSGTIALKTQLKVTRPNTTIAGQTAPGDGICLRDRSFVIATQNVIVRYLRVRLGDVSKTESDSITIGHGCRNVILDHCSASWSVDECLSTSGDVGDTTIQWSIISEALCKSVHKKGSHGYGSLARANGPVSWHHNLWAHNEARNPRLGDNYGKGTSPLFDVRNNVIYDYGEIASGLTQGTFPANYIGNYLRPGPSSTAKAPISVGGPSKLRFFLRDNVFEGHETMTTDNSRFFNQTQIGGQQQVEIVAQPFDTAPVTTTSAQQALDAVLAHAGASRPTRDAVDQRIISEVRQRTGHLVNSQQDVGGWPDLKSEPAPTDTDHDGIPDAWETAHGLNPADPADGRKIHGSDGYTNLELYLNEVADPETTAHPSTNERQ